MVSKLFSLVLTACLLSPTLALWPQPTSMEAGTKALKLSSGFRFDVAIKNAPKDLLAAVERTKGFIEKDDLERLVVGRGEADAKALGSAKTLSKLRIELTGNTAASSIATEAIKKIGTKKEAYTLDVPADGSQAVLKAESTLGLLHGLQTFSQMWYLSGRTTYTIMAPLKINDSPAYPYRGFMLDTARNYFPVKDIKRTIDAMSWVKMSTLHWHVVDSQSFPLVVPGYTELSATGAYDAKSIYSVKDVQDIVAYAAERGIDVIAEIDTPGHTAVIAKSHPEHIACPEASPWTQFANEPPAGQLRLASPKTIEFSSGLLTSASKLFKSSYFSTGGDEVNANCYAKDTQTQTDLNGRTFDQGLSDFKVAMHGALRKVNKTPVVWQEMVLAHNVTLGNDTVVLVWISSADAASVTKKGFQIVHAASDYFYLDCGMGGWVGNNPNGNSWCDPFKTWQKGYSFNPTANMSDSEAKLVLGGQSLLWAEQSSPENLDSAVWPRAAANAEVFWSGPGGDGKAAFSRLHDIAYRMRQRGVGAIALQPLWCVLRPNACDLDA